MVLAVKKHPKADLVPQTPAQRLARLLDPAARTLPARLVRGINITVVLAGLAAVVLASDPGFHDGVEPVVVVALVMFGIEYLGRLWVAPERVRCAAEKAGLARRRWASSPLGVVDLLSALAIPAALLAGVPAIEADLLGVLWVFKLARYSQGLAVLGRAVCMEAEPLLGVLFAFLVVLLCAAVLAHVIEGEGQPEVFGTVPKALWWTIVTLTTTGYGDVVPQTAAGRLLGGVVMMCGIGVFALWAAILATGFSQEMRRRAFVKTWDLVARVPLFRDVGASVIAEVAQRLRQREVAPGGTVVRKGEPGDCMYFIVSGEVEIELPSRSLHLTDGDFFGELALITGERRNATTTASKETQLLVLDIADFRDLAARYPVLTNAIQREAERRLGQHVPADDLE
jgi:voltage-gated potassium channel